MQIVQIDRAQAKPVANPDLFRGTVYQHRHETDSPLGVEFVGVWFEPGSRTRPHIHAVDQILQVVEGEGVVATETEKRIIRPGDWVVVPAGTWHWHGATPDSALCHISIKQPSDTDWDAPWKDFDAYMEGAQ